MLSPSLALTSIDEPSLFTKKKFIFAEPEEEEEEKYLLKGNDKCGL